MDPFVAGLKVYVKEGHPDIGDLPEPFNPSEDNYYGAVGAFSF
jgi:hypothetical protein